MELREHRRIPDDELLEVGEADGFAVETEIGIKQDVWLIERLVVDGIDQAANEVLVLFGGHASSSPPLNRPSPQLVTCPSESCHQTVNKVSTPTLVPSPVVRYLWLRLAIMRLRHRSPPARGARTAACARHPAARRGQGTLGY